MLLGLVLVLVWGASGFFRVQPNQQAIQLVFGKPYGKPVEPGLHYNLPAPIGNVVVVNVQDQRRTVLGFVVLVLGLDRQHQRMVLAVDAGELGLDLIADLDHEGRVVDAVARPLPRRYRPGR